MNGSGFRHVESMLGARVVIGDMEAQRYGKLRTAEQNCSALSLGRMNRPYAVLNITYLSLIAS